MPPRARAAARLTLPLVLVIVVGLYALARRPFSWYAALGPVERGVAGPAPRATVPLEAHIISKCPDTRDALRLLILPAMQRLQDKRLQDKVDFKLNYIGTPTAGDGVKCMHGPTECLGNIIELCARELYPDPMISLGFIMCLTKEYKMIPDRTLVEDCALEHAVDFQSLNRCATPDEGGHGLELLRASVQRTAQANVTTSCTIRLDDQIYCIRDGGEWKDCPRGPGVDDLVAAIQEKLRQQPS